MFFTKTMAGERKDLAMSVFYTFAALGFLARCSSGEMCVVDSMDPDSMTCNTGMDGSASADSTVFESLTVARAPTVPGLSFDFYDNSCPDYKSIIQQAITEALQANPGQAPGLTRILYHDCFIQGCDASVLLTGTNSEQSAIPNQTLRPESLQLIEQIKSKLEQTCPNTVSCADIIAVAATEAISQVQGPSIQMPVGRRDSRSPSSIDVTTNLPSPFNTVSQNFPIFSKLGFDFTDYTALIGAHTLGRAHCVAFSGRLHPLDVNLDSNFGNSLSQLCSQNSNNVHSLDDTPNLFDNDYYKQILSGDVLLTSDAAMELDSRTVPLVSKYARNSGTFKSQFVRSLLKMSQLSVLTGSAGEIRKTCSSS